MPLPLGLALLALAMPTADALPATAIRVQYVGDNGSLPPPYRRSTEIRIDADGRGTLLRRHGYDLQDASQQFEISFVVDADRRVALAQRLDELRVWDVRWKEMQRAPVGGPLVHLRLARGDREIVVPEFPIASQRELADTLRADVLALVPESAIAARNRWEQDKGDPE